MNKTILTVKEFVKSLSNPSNLYFIVGTDNVLIDSCLKHLAKLVPQDFADFNFRVFYHLETPLTTVIDDANTSPFFSSPKIIVLKGLKNLTETETKAGLRYFENYNPKSILILTAQNYDARLKFFKSLKKNAIEVCCDNLKGNSLNQWIKSEFGNLGFQINPKSISVLIERTAGNTSLIKSEIEKLSIYAHGEQEITLEAIKTLSILSPNSNVFELGDSLGDGNSGQALHALNDLLEVEHYLVIFNMIVRHFRLLLKAKSWIWGSDGARNTDAAKILGVPSFIVSKYLNQAKKWPWKSLFKALLILENFRIKSQTQSIPIDTSMNNLVLNLSLLIK